MNADDIGPGSHIMQPEARPRVTNRKKTLIVWTVIDGVNIPCVRRGDTTYVCIRIIEHKLIAGFSQLCKDLVGNTDIDTYPLHSTESKLLNNINRLPSGWAFGQHRFTHDDVLITFSDFQKNYEIVKRLFVQHPTEEKITENAEDKMLDLSEYGGWNQVNNAIIPFVVRSCSRLFPLTVLQQSAGLLKNTSVKEIPLSTDEISLLNTMCACSGFDFNFVSTTHGVEVMELYQHHPSITVIQLPFDDPLGKAKYLSNVQAQHQISPPVVYPPVDNCHISTKVSQQQTNLNTPATCYSDGTYQDKLSSIVTDSAEEQHLSQINCHSAKMPTQNNNSTPNNCGNNNYAQNFAVPHAQSRMIPQHLQGREAGPTRNNTVFSSHLQSQNGSTSYVQSQDTSPPRVYNQTLSASNIPNTMPPIYANNNCNREMRQTPTNKHGYGYSHDQPYQIMNAVQPINVNNHAFPNNHIGMATNPSETNAAYVNCNDKTQIQRGADSISHQNKAQMLVPKTQQQYVINEAEIPISYLKENVLPKVAQIKVLQFAGKNLPCMYLNLKSTEGCEWYCLVNDLRKLYFSLDFNTFEHALKLFGIPIQAATPADMLAYVFNFGLRSSDMRSNKIVKFACFKQFYVYALELRNAAVRRQNETTKDHHIAVNSPASFIQTQTMCSVPTGSKRQNEYVSDTPASKVRLIHNQQTPVISNYVQGQALPTFNTNRTRFQTCVQPTSIPSVQGGNVSALQWESSSSRQLTIPYPMQTTEPRSIQSTFPSSHTVLGSPGQPTISSTITPKQRVVSTWQLNLIEEYCSGSNNTDLRETTGNSECLSMLENQQVPDINQPRCNSEVAVCANYASYSKTDDGVIVLD